MLLSSAVLQPRRPADAVFTRVCERDNISSAFLMSTRLACHAAKVLMLRYI